MKCGFGGLTWFPNIVCFSFVSNSNLQNIEVREETTVVTTTGSMGDVIGGTERLPIGGGAGVGTGVNDIARVDTPRIDTPRGDFPRGDIPRGDIPRGEVRDLA